MHQNKKKLPIGIDNFEKLRLNDFYYVDKTGLIKELLNNWGEVNLFTRPRRFGKSLNMSMLENFFSIEKNQDIFHGLKIAKETTFCEEYMGKYPVISISLKSVNAASFESAFQLTAQIIAEAAEKVQFLMESEQLTEYNRNEYQKLLEDMSEAELFGSLKKLTRLLSRHYDMPVILLIDEYDVPLAKAYENGYYEQMVFLIRNLFDQVLKGNENLKFAVLTGCMRISKESIFTGLNNLRVLSVSDVEFDEYFGFTDEEVQELLSYYRCTDKYHVIKEWYDGYYKSDDTSLFNPRSVSLALQKGKCKNYWTETGPMNEIAEYIEHNVDEVREDIVKMVAGIPIEVELEGYAASQLQLDSRDEILSAMVVFGFLSYHDGFLRIPNHELMEKFQRVLKRKSMGSVADIVNNSKNVLDATIALDGQKVAQYIEEAHDREIPFLQYNNENSLSCVITLCYLYARNYYDVTREDKSGKGYVDYLFTPKKKGYPAIILELKYNKCAEEAIDQIKKKNYVERVKDFDEILFVGINYSTDADEHKHHDCIIEKYK